MLNLQNKFTDRRQSNEAIEQEYNISKNKRALEHVSTLKFHGSIKCGKCRGSTNLLT